jgi:mono/diheme cytochrome c family protein
VVRLALVLLGLVVAMLLAGCGGSDGTAQGTTTETVETAATTGTGDGQGGDAGRGEALFASAGCGGCHTLSEAGSSGSIGPNLDDASPSFDKVVERVTDGAGVMPSFADRLSAQEIRDVAAFVSGATRD